MNDEEPPFRFPAVLEPGPRLELLERLRAYAGQYTELNRHSARALSLHVTDSNALVELLWAERLGEPLSPARLAERVGLTSGATNALVNRLEKAGYVIRSREHTDRRQVSLRVTPQAVARTQQLLARPAGLLDQALDRFEPEVLAELVSVLDVLTATLARINSEPAGD